MNTASRCIGSKICRSPSRARSTTARAKFPTIFHAVSKLPAELLVLDGEAVIETDQDGTDFNELQKYVLPKDPPRSCCPRLVYYAFDILYLDGFDLREVRLIERKEVLRLLPHYCFA